MEAGGTVTNQFGEPVGASDPFVVASNGSIHHSFIETLRDTAPSS